jgi:hypothetical protein
VTSNEEDVLAHRFQSLGFSQHISGDRQVAAQERFDQRYNQAIKYRTHLWIATVCFHIPDPPLHDGAILDADSMAFSPAVGCYICEEPWQEQMNYRACPGEPRPKASE